MRSGGPFFATILVVMAQSADCFVRGDVAPRTVFSATKTPPKTRFGMLRKSNGGDHSKKKKRDPQERVAAMTAAFDETVGKNWPDQWLAAPEDRAKIGATFRFYLRVVVVSFLIRWFVVEPRYIPSASMVPTLRVGDQLAVEKLSTLVRTPRQSEVVLFRPPDGVAKKKNQVYIKRVVGEPGDTVEIHDGLVFVNGRLLEEPYCSTDDIPQYDFGPADVPPNFLFVLGDNRNHSFDSHLWGFLPVENVIGHAILRYWPLERFGLIEH